MAARLRKVHQDDVRAKIQTSQLVNRLTDHALGQNNVKLEASQVRAIEVLLKKTIPDLASIELTGDAENPVEVTTRVELVGVLPDDNGSVKNPG